MLLARTTKIFINVNKKNKRTQFEIKVVSISTSMLSVLLAYSQYFYDYKNM